MWQWRRSNDNYQSQNPAMHDVYIYIAFKRLEVKRQCFGNIYNIIIFVTREKTLVNIMMKKKNTQFLLQFYYYYTCHNLILFLRQKLIQRNYY